MPWMLFGQDSQNVKRQMRSGVLISALELFSTTSSETASPSSVLLTKSETPALVEFVLVEHHECARDVVVAHLHTAED